MKYFKRSCIILLIIAVCMSPVTVTAKKKGFYRYISESYGAHAMGLEYLKSQLAGKMTSKTVKVAVFDTSILKDHDVFKGRVVKNRMGLSKGSHFHGTAVAGVIADCTPANVQIYGYQVDIDKPDSFKKALKAAMRDNVQVITMCIGHSQSKSDNAIDILLQRAYKKNIILVAAAANNKENGKKIFPANSEYTYGVSALKAPRSSHDKISDMSFDYSYSNFGRTISFSAPGTRVLITREGNYHRYIESMGTSFATPHIASCFAYLKLRYPHMNNEALFGILKKYCVDKGKKGYDYYYGWGVPDLRRLFDKQLGSMTDNKAVIHRVKRQSRTKKQNGKKFRYRTIRYNAVNNATYKLYRRPLTDCKDGWEMVMSARSKKMKSRNGCYRYTDKTALSSVRYEYLLHVRTKKRNYLSHYAVD